MIVYVVEWVEDYQGGDVVAVALSEAGARKAAEDDYAEFRRRGSMPELVWFDTTRGSGRTLRAYPGGERTSSGWCCSYYVAECDTVD